MGYDQNGVEVAAERDCWEGVFIYFFKFLGTFLFDAEDCLYTVLLALLLTSSVAADWTGPWTEAEDSPTRAGYNGCVSERDL